MEKINLDKLKNNEHFIKGKNEKPKPDSSIKFRWYKKLISKKEYQQSTSLCVLEEQGVGNAKQYMVAFMSVEPQECLQVIEPEQLMAIDNFLRARNLHPFVTENKPNSVF